MAQVASVSLVRQIGSLFEGGSVSGLSDRQLLERFARRDPAGEAAFAALVARHGPMVLGVCRQLVGDRHHAEDAFQAVFLVLARKAGSVREPELLGNWLYGVALRTARKARRRIARHGKTDLAGNVGRPAAGAAAPPEKALIDREEAEALHCEIDRLPGAFRLPVVLCYFEGLSPDEAANRLRWPAGTLRSRLVRARAKLRRGLTRRGVVLPAITLTAALAPRSSWASFSPLLCDVTSRAASAFVARQTRSDAVSAAARALAQEVLQTMLLHRVKSLTLSLLVVAALAGGGGYVSQSLAMKDEPMENATGQPPRFEPASDPRKGKQPPPATKPGAVDSGRMIVTGQVLGPDGKPAAGAPVDVIGAPRAPEEGADVDRKAFVPLGQGVADSDGRYRIEAARARSDRFLQVYVLAGASGPGSAFGSVKLDEDAQSPGAEVRLQSEQVIRGRLVDVGGQPAAGVEVRLNSVYRATPPAGAASFDSPSPGRGSALPALPEEVRAWPKAVTTDSQGRFVLPGVGRGLYASLAVRDPRFAQQRIEFQTDDRDGPKEVSAALHPATIIEGRVLAADTGLTIPDAVIAVRSSSGIGGGMATTKFRADSQGRFKINPYAGDYFRMHAFAPAGQAYVAREFEFAWTKGAVKKEIDLTLARGVLLRGKAIEEGSGRPIAGASVQFFAMHQSGDVVDDCEEIVASLDDGSFQVAVPPGKGHVMVLGPTLNYIPQQIAGGKLFGSGHPGGWRFYAHAIIAYDVKAGESVHELTATLRPGKTLRGRLAGPAGEPVQDAVVLTRQQLDPINLTWQPYNFIQTRAGRFELPGFDPEKAAPVYFLDADHEWGAVVELSGNQASEEHRVQLRPCGQAKMRFVGPDGKPVAKLPVWPFVQLLMTPGPSSSGRCDLGQSLNSDAAYLVNVDFKHHPTDRVTDADGRITLTALIPGAPYRIGDNSTFNLQGKGYQLRRDFTVQPGETVDLGDILVEKPGP